MSPTKSQVEEELEKLEALKFSSSNDSSSHQGNETALLNGSVSKQGQQSPLSKDETTTVTSVVPTTQSSSSTSHSRQSSLASSTASNEAKNQRTTQGLGDCHKGLMVGLHRKMVIFLMKIRNFEKEQKISFNIQANTVEHPEISQVCNLPSFFEFFL